MERIYHFLTRILTRTTLQKNSNVAVRLWSTALLVFCAGLFCSSEPVFAQLPVTCTHLDRSSTELLPQGFGSPVDWHVNVGQLLLQVSCEGDKMRIYVGDVVNPTSSHAIYKFGYVYKSGAWRQFTFEGQATQNAWILGATQAELTVVPKELQEGAYVVAYVCAKDVRQTWRCGCRDTVCSENLWQLQKVKVSTITSTAVDIQGLGLVNEIKSRVFAISNKERTNRGLVSLTWDSALANVAKEHSRDMANRFYFDHESPDLCDPGCRLDTAKYQYRVYRENLYFAVNSFGLRADDVSADTVEGWLQSEGHRRNLLANDIVNTGVGVAIAGNTVYVTTLYSTPR